MTLPRMAHKAASVVGVVALVIALFSIAGFVYQQIGAWKDARRFPQVGRSVDVGGRKLNLECSGQAAPTVILESGHGVPGLAWTAVQSRISALTRTCWYDRAGYGWSDAGPFPRHSDEIARDLHALLSNGRVAPPYILVGHGFGAFNVRAFRGRYPDEVAGMVLVDPPSDDPGPDNPTVPPKQHIESLRPAMVLVFRVLGELGFWRLKRKDLAPPSGFAPGEWETLSALMIQPKSLAARVQETPLRASAAQVRAARDLGGIPLIVVFPGIPMEADSWQRRRFELQSALAKLSTEGKQVIVPNVGGMWWPYSAPNVVESIIQIIAEVRTRQRLSVRVATRENR